MTELITPDTPTTNGTIPAETESLLRERAIRQLKKRRDFRAHLLAYVLVNAFLWLVWGVVYLAAAGPWFPWPLLPLFGWGIGLTFHAWDTYGRKPFTEEEIGRETDRLRPGGFR
jgi:hypothetical protein